MLRNLNLKDLFSQDVKLTFLVGAGCSVSFPSCYPLAKDMMKAIIQHFCAESEINKIQGLLDSNLLRFEMLIEIIRDVIDSNLKIIDYYELSDKPNILHFYLVQMIIKGHFVLTTNYDFLIEHALLQSKISKNEIICIITEEDFKKYDEPSILYENGKKTLYKIHGSTKNIITNENTRQSLISTISSFGLNKEGLNIFQVESYKRSLFNNISNSRTLIVLGYSGSDDFDVIPTIKVLKGWNNIIWINHVEDQDRDEKIYEIMQEDEDDFTNFDKITQILLDFKQMGYAKKIFRIDVNTTKLIESLTTNKFLINDKRFSLHPKKWFEENFKELKDQDKFFISYRIYHCFNEYNECLKCLKKALDIINKLHEPLPKATILDAIGGIYTDLGDYKNALRYYRKALNLVEDREKIILKAEILNNIGTIYRHLGEINNALENFENALQISKALNNETTIAAILSNLADIYIEKGKSDKALNLLEKALEIAIRIGKVQNRAIYLSNIGRIFTDKSNFVEALKYLNESLKLERMLGNLPGVCDRNNNIGNIYLYNKNYPKALEYYNKALKMSEKLNDLPRMAECLNNLGYLYIETKQFILARYHLVKRKKVLIRLGLQNSPQFKELIEDIEKISNIDSNG